MADGRAYQQLKDGSFVPLEVFERVRQGADDEPLPETGKAVYRRYVDLTYLQPHIAVPVFLVVFVLFLYLLGKTMAAGIGAFFWRQFGGLFIGCRWSASSIPPSSK